MEIRQSHRGLTATELIGLVCSRKRSSFPEAISQTVNKWPDAETTKSPRGLTANALIGFLCLRK